MENELDIQLTDQELKELLKDLPNILRQLTADTQNQPGTIIRTNSCS